MAQQGAIEFNDQPDGSGSCVIPELGLNNSATFYIIAKDLWQSGGLQGAEFSVNGFPSSGYLLNVTPSPETSIALGNPFTGGANVVFDACQEGVVLLYTVQITQVLEDVEPVMGFIAQKESPSRASCDGLAVWLELFCHP